MNSFYNQKFLYESYNMSLSCEVYSNNIFFECLLYISSRH